MRFKPWMLAITLQGMELMKAGFDPALGLDQHFYDQAKESGKTVQGLETVEFQISRFDTMTMEQQDRMLAETLKELATETATVGKLGDAWKAGDVPAIERIALADLKSDPAMYQRLLVERNRNWMPKIEALFARKGRALVVVGAAHLVGPDGLIAMLQGKGLHGRAALKAVRGSWCRVQRSLGVRSSGFNVRGSFGVRGSGFELRTQHREPRTNPEH